MELLKFFAGIRPFPPKWVLKVVPKIFIPISIKEGEYHWLGLSIHVDSIIGESLFMYLRRKLLVK